MILCLNANAAIDKTVTVPAFRLGRIHRPTTVIALPGGKGCNVARALQQLGAKPVVAGWVGGCAGQFIAAGLHREGIATDFTPTDVESRTCLSILDEATGVMTEIYENGAPLPPDTVTALVDHFQAIVGRFAAVTLSGSLPPGAPPDFYATLIEIAHAANVPTYLDSSKEALRDGVAARPFLIKPNQAEIGALTARPLHSLADYAAAAADIAARYETIVLLSLGQDGAIAAGNGELLRVYTPPVAAQSAVGSGDCLLAGLAYGFTTGLPLAEAVRCGVAAGTANTLTLGAGRFALTDFHSILAQVVVREEIGDNDAAGSR
ncbi:MAG: 1-phosphofructokinase family hexose kinase [Chloroflexi bacterium]|nr:1-phosphofructokinase family hexose kinase [Chloroflexota bacterium]